MTSLDYRMTNEMAQVIKNDLAATPHTMRLGSFVVR